MIKLNLKPTYQKNPQKDIFTVMLAVSYASLTASKTTQATG